MVVFLLSTVSAWGNPTGFFRILPLGDAATQSDSQHLSYRYSFWKKCLDADMHFDLVGSNRDNDGANPVWPEYNGRTFDRDHEGHRAFSLDRINDSLVSHLSCATPWHARYQPDIVLFQPGRYDILHGRGVSATAQDIRQSIRLLRDQNGSVLILLATTLPSEDSQSQVNLEELNDSIVAIAHQLHSDQSPIYMVDQADGFSPTNDATGDIPNESGEEKLARKWFDALESALSRRIMPLGNSITDGGAEGYRYPLYQRLVGDGYDVDFVGTRTSGTWDNGMDRNHQGIPGWLIKQISEDPVSCHHAFDPEPDNWKGGISDSYGKFLDTIHPHTPEAILLHIGTNDIIKVTDSVPGMPGRYSTLIDSLTSRSPYADIFVGSVIPTTFTFDTAVCTHFGSLYDSVVSFNAKLDDSVAAWSSTGKRVHYVDLFSQIDTLNDLADGIHPDSSGYAKMANAWYDALQGFLKPTRILALGDQLTFDHYTGDTRPISERAGWRSHLEELLLADGRHFDFTGHLDAGSQLLGDGGNAGIPGIRDDQLKELLATGYDSVSQTQVTPGPYLDSYHPDIVLLHIGTNRLSNSASQIEGILDEIDAHESRTGNTVTVLVSRILNEATIDPEISEFNDNISALVSDRVLNGDQVVLVDIEQGAGIDYGTDMLNTVHPNETGFRKMAEAWHNALTPVLNGDLVPIAGPVPPDTLRITPLGNSITTGSYRYYLADILSDKGIAVDYFGTVTDKYADPGYDPHHEGHPGWVIQGSGFENVPCDPAWYPKTDDNAWRWDRSDKGLAEHYRTWNSAYPSQPDIILLLIGTNDLWHIPDSLPGMPERYSRLIDSVTTVSPNAHIIVSSITPMSVCYSGDNCYTGCLIDLVDAFNPHIPDTVEAWARRGRKVHFVDLNAIPGLYDIIESGDGVHPNDEGQQLMAEVWHKGIQRILSAPWISLKTPFDGEVLPEGVSVTMRARADFISEDLEKVEFLINGIKVGEDLSAPYSFTWAAPPAGTYSITARAVSVSGYYGTSHSSDLTIGSYEIMPLGGSLTAGEGSSDAGGFRTYLWPAISSGLSIDFVGSEASGPTHIDRDHEGHAGYTLSSLQTEFSTLTAQFSPEAVLLTAGESEPNDTTVAQRIAGLDAILDSIHTLLPNAALLVTSPTPITDQAHAPDSIAPFGRGVEQLVLSKVRQNRRTVFVDGRRSIDPLSDLTSGGLLPNDNGYEKIAQKIQNRLAAVLRGNIPPAVFIEFPREGDTLDEIKSISAAVLAADCDGEIASIEAAVDDASFTPISEIVNGRYRFEWLKPSPGDHSLHIRAIDNAGDTTESEMQVSIRPDSTAPEIVLVSCESLQRILITFNEPVDSVSACNPGNFSIDNGVTVDSVHSASDSQVTLYVSPLTYDSGYNLHVANIRDASHAKNEISPVLMPFSLKSIKAGLLLHYPFDDTSETTAFDSSGHGRNATIANATRVSGRLGSALSFSGASADSVVDLDAGTYLNGLSEFSISLWIKSNEINTDRGFIFGRNTGPQTFDLPLCIRYDKAGSRSGRDQVIKAVVQCDDGHQGLESSEYLQTTDWQHLVMAWKSGEPMRLYVNGMQDEKAFRDYGTTDNEPPTGSTVGIEKLIVGKGASNSTDSWNGLVDDVRVYGTAISDDDATCLYAYTGPASRELTLAAGEGGIVTPSGTVTTIAGYPRTIDATPEQGFTFDHWVTTNGSATIADPFSETTTVTLGNEDAVISALFAASTGSVHLQNIPDDAKVFAYASNGWIGRQVRVGEGTVTGLPPGVNRFAVRAPGRRTVYGSITVSSGSTDTLSVGSSALIPLMFIDTVTTTCDGNAITTAEPSYAVFEDFDNDADNDLLLGSLSGFFTCYRRDDTGYVACPGPTTEAGISLEVSDGIRGIRSVDWNADGKIDLVIADSTNTISLYRRTGGVSEFSFEAPAILYEVPEGDVSGFDIVDYNLDGYPDFVIGFDDGEVKRSQFSGIEWDSPAWETPVSLETAQGSLVTASGAAPCMIDCSGDGVLDLVTGGDDGSLYLFTALDNGLYQLAGEFNAGGAALQTGGRSFPALIPATIDSLPIICLGANYAAVLKSRLSGDFFIDMFDIVDINDFAEFGDAFGAEELDETWNSRQPCNLDLKPNNEGRQSIDSGDLTRFGDTWGKAK